MARPDPDSGADFTVNPGPASGAFPAFTSTAAPRLRVPPDVARAFREAGKRQGWWQCTDPLVVAVSGGGDSMALLLLFASLWHRQRLVVAHLEHGIRGEASLADARFVEEWARRLALPFEMERGNVLGRREKGESVEAAARRIRYAFLDDVRRRRGARWVATAHTLDDQAESVLHHILRGTGLRGLAGIAEVRDGFVRPLLRLGGEALRRMLRDSGITWCEDATNRETTYLRNRLRREVLPYLAKTVNENALAHLAALGEDAAEAESLRRRRTEALLPTLRVHLPYGKCVWRVAAARRLGSYDLRHALRDEGERLGLPLLSRRRLEELERLLCTSGTWRFQWSGEEELLCGGGFLCWGNRSMLVPPPEARLELELCFRPNRAVTRGAFLWGTWRVRWSLEILETPETSQTPASPETLKTPEPLETLDALGTSAPSVAPTTTKTPTIPAPSEILAPSANPRTLAAPKIGEISECLASPECAAALESRSARLPELLRTPGKAAPPGHFHGCSASEKCPASACFSAPCPDPCAGSSLAVSVVLRSVEHLDLAPEEKARVPWWCRPGTPAVLFPGLPPLIPLWSSPQETTAATSTCVLASTTTPASATVPALSPEASASSADPATDTPSTEADGSAAGAQLFCFASFRNHARITRFSVVLERTSE